MAEQGCQTPGQMLFYMNKAAKDLHGKADLKDFLESEEASYKTPEEKTNALYDIHTKAVASCKAVAAELAALEEEDSPIIDLLKAKLPIDIKNLSESVSKGVGDAKSAIGLRVGNAKSAIGSRVENLNPFRNGGRKTKKSKGKKNSSKKNKPKK